MVYDLLYDSDTVVIGIFLAGLLLIPFFMSIKLIIESRQRARAAGHRRVIDHLRAVPQTDQEKKEAVAMMLRGIVICMLGIVLQPLALFGVFPLYYGGRKVALALLGIDLLGEADDADRLV